MIKGYKHLSKEEKMDIANLYKQGKAIKEIALLYKKNATTIYNALVYYGVDIRKQSAYSLDEATRNQIPLMYKDGMDIVEISNKLKCSKGFVWGILKENGIVARRTRIFRKKAQDCIEIYERFIKGESLSSLTQYYHVSIDSIIRVLYEKGITKEAIKNSHKYYFLTKDNKELFLKSDREMIIADLLDNNCLNWKYEPNIYINEGFRFTPDFIIYDKNNNERYWVDSKSFGCSISLTKSKFRKSAKDIISLCKKHNDKCEFVITNPTNEKLVIEGIIFNLKENK